MHPIPTVGRMDCILPRDVYAAIEKIPEIIKRLNLKNLTDENEIKQETIFVALQTEYSKPEIYEDTEDESRHFFKKIAENKEFFLLESLEKKDQMAIAKKEDTRFQKV